MKRAKTVAIVMTASVGFLALGCQSVTDGFSTVNGWISGAEEKMDQTQRAFDRTKGIVNDSRSTVNEVRSFAGN